MISIPLSLTKPSSCNYLEKQYSQSAFVHPSFSLSTASYSQLIAQGFRRSGNEVYMPYCASCAECISSRLAVDEFIPNKNQKRCLKKNNHTSINIKPAKFEQTHYDMYMRYQKHRHFEGEMAYSSPKEYIDFLSSRWCHTVFIEFLIDNHLAAVAIVDVLENALSAVYTFFEAEYSHYSLGTYAILWQIEYAKKLNLEFVYMGFWINNCRKMSYKIKFQPMQGYLEKEWKTIIPPSQQGTATV